MPGQEEDDVTKHKAQSSQRARHALEAWAAGLVLPSVLACVSAMAGLFPIGSFLPESSIISPIGFLVAILFIVGAVPVVAILAALVRRSWFPLGIGGIAFLGLLVGAVLSIGLYQALEGVALKLACDRSAILTQAIESYDRGYNRPPERLSELVPEFLVDVPSTGMAAHPSYRYGADSGPCSKASLWHLSVSVGADDLIYCPGQDYEKLLHDASFEVSRIGTWARSSWMD